MARSTKTTERIVVKATCSRCGRPIVLVADDNGVEVPDRVQFLAMHRTCVRELVHEAETEASSRG